MTEPQTIANLFNSYFANIHKEIITNIPDAPRINLRTNRPSSMALFPTDEEEVTKIINGLKKSNSTGIDDLSNNTLKMISPYLAAPLTFFINRSLALGYFPKTLKKSIITPIYKKGNKNEKANYRPISLITSVAKIFEYVIYTRLRHYLSSMNILHDNQHGFLQKKSTITAINEFYGHLLQMLEEGMCPVGIFCDLSRAFDCVQHDILLEKLHEYGIRGIALNWFTSYLKGRTQMVRLSYTDEANKLTTYTSSEQAVLAGVPQGSVLGPLLFIIFINDLVSHFQNPIELKEAKESEEVILQSPVPEEEHVTEITIYADDTSLITTGRTLELGLRHSAEALQRLQEWFAANKLYLNSAKTVYMLFHLTKNITNNPMKLYVNDLEISKVSTTSFLGLQIDEEIRWETHCNCLGKKLNSCCFQLKLLKNTISSSYLLQYYYANVQARISYGIIFWGPTSHANRILISQKRILRTIFGVPTRDSCRPIFKKHGILTVTALYVLEVTKYIRNTIGDYQKRGDAHQYPVRNYQDTNS